MQNNKKRILIIVTSIIVLITIIGFSYAYFAADIIGNENTSSIVGRGAYLELTFADGEDTITGTNIVPGWSASKTFTVTNTGNRGAYYSIKVFNIINTFSALRSITFSLTSLDGGKGLPNMPLPSTDKTVVDSIYIESSDVHTYTVTVYYSNMTSDQSADIGASFSFDICIEGSQNNEPKGWSNPGTGTLLSGIKTNNPTTTDFLTIPALQTTYSQGRDTAVTTANQSKYWTYADGYDLDTTTGKFYLTGVHHGIYNSIYSNLSNKYLSSWTPVSSNDEAIDTSGLTVVYQIEGAIANRMFVKNVIFSVEVNATYRDYYWTYGTGYEQSYMATTTNGPYRLTGINTVKYSDNKEVLVGKYVMGTTANSMSKATNTALTDADFVAEKVYKVIQVANNYMIIEPIKEGVFMASNDDYGTSYYYRGIIENNYVSFANMCWRIVRIVGDGSIKLVLYNYNPTNASNPCAASLDGTGKAFARYDDTESGQAGLTKFNESDNKNAYVGFMFSNNVDSSSLSTAQANDNDSLVLTNLKTWYDLVFSSSDKEKLADVIWCNDKRIITDTSYNPSSMSNLMGTGLGSNNTYYQAIQRNTTNYSPSLKCGESKTDNMVSKFTASSSTDGGYGNGALNGYKIGLLTADEVIFAGGVTSFWPSNSYLLRNGIDGGNAYWTMTPVFYRNNAYLYGNAINGYVDYIKASSSSVGLRPAIALKSNTTISGGNGTQANPFVIN